MNKKLKKQIEQKLVKLHELLDKFDEARAIEPDEPETWDSDTLYNLVENLKEALTILEDKKAKGKNFYEDPLILQEGLCSLLDIYQNDQEEDNNA